VEEVQRVVAELPRLEQSQRRRPREPLFLERLRDAQRALAEAGPTRKLLYRFKSQAAAVRRV
jgi:hypothetical protein